MCLRYVCVDTQIPMEESGGNVAGQHEQEIYRTPLQHILARTPYIANTQGSSVGAEPKSLPARFCTPKDTIDNTPMSSTPDTNKHAHTSKHMHM